MNDNPSQDIEASGDQNFLPRSILIVDDEIANLKLLAELLTQQGYQVRPTESPQLAIDSAFSQPPSLILLDVKMPIIDGFEVCRRLKQDARTRDIPVIFISALQSTDDKVRGFEAGGVDFITKPIQEDEVLARVRTHMELRHMRNNLEQLVLMRSAELGKSEAKYRGLVDNAVVGVFASTLDGRFTFVNDAMVRLYDFDTPEQMIAEGSLSRWKDLSKRELLMADLNTQGVVTNREAETVTHKGRHIHIIFSVKRVAEDIIGMVMDITDRKQAELELQKAYEEIKQLQSKLEAESAYLQDEIKLEHNFENIIGQSEPLKYVLNRVQMVAPQDSAVIILGETGTGKELIARAIHQLSARSGRPLVKVNCAALPDDLIESELFGREKGAYTGAMTTQAGRFEIANNSTLFLDEIGELPLSLQAKLLRVLESGKFERLGNPLTLHSDTRIVAATNRDLEEEVKQKRFREDLWYRLKIFPVTVPPLRDRIDDVPLLVDHFVRFFARKMGKKYEDLHISASSMQAMQAYSWPGNVRELKNVIEAALISTNGDKLHFILPITSEARTTNLKTFEEMERDYILKVLDHAKWKVDGENSASTILGMPESTLRSRMKKLGIQRP
jgi:PAS domain S-box-containing protein